MAGMRLSRRSEYGLRALTDLARTGSQVTVPLATLASRNNLPPKFLEQIMATLKRGGIVRTTLGAHGGYALADDPKNVSVGRVIRLLDGALAPLPCVSLRYYTPCSCPDEATCALRDVMLDVRDATLAILDEESLAAMAARGGRASVDPRGIHAEALAGRRP
jgi:Rrf2 family transcriptional regulator, cysteine metabolism repressor